VPHDSTSTLGQPRSSSACRSSASAMGERHRLPVHTKTTLMAWKVRAGVTSSFSVRVRP
jgi:hypothetical protein